MTTFILVQLFHGEYGGLQASELWGAYVLIKVRVGFRTALSNGGQRKAAFLSRTYWGRPRLFLVPPERLQVWDSQIQARQRFF